MIEIRPAGRAEADYVIDRAWDRGLAEYDGGRDEMRANLRMYATTPETFAIWSDDEPIAFFGMFEVAPRKFYTWFQATDEYVKRGTRATVVSRKFLVEWVSRHPGATLEVMTASKHPLAQRWFEVLGFSLVERNEIYARYAYNVEFVE